jgi:predicted transcriptional regulator of viral defense system
MSIEQQLRQFEGQPLTRQILLGMLGEYKRPYDKINELVKQKILIPVKRGIFIPGPSANVQQPEPYLLANHLAGPSYISLESALSYWSFIPERVYEVSSMTTGRSKIYDTSTGRFSYTQLPLPYFSFGQVSVQIEKKQVVLMASPEKALCDKIVTTAGLVFRSAKQLSEWLTADMRMEKEKLGTLQWEKMEDWIPSSPKKSSLAYLIQTLKNL